MTLLSEKKISRKGVTKKQGNAGNIKGEWNLETATDLHLYAEALVSAVLTRAFHLSETILGTTILIHYATMFFRSPNRTMVYIFKIPFGESRDQYLKHPKIQRPKWGPI